MRVRPLLAVCCLAAAACGGPSKRIVIGTAGPWGEWNGDMAKKGVILAVAEINAAGGVHGRQIELRERDDQRDGERAAQVAQDFVSDPNVLGVIGHVTSGAMVPAAKVYDGGHLVAIATSATSPALTGISPWVFRVISSDSVNGAVLARFASDLGRKRAAVIYENDAYGRGLADTFRRNFTGQVVSMDPIGAALPDAEPYVSFYKQRGVDVVIGIGYQATGLALLREARRDRLAADFVGGDGWSAIVTDTAQAEGVYIGTAFTAEDPRPEVQKFVKAFRDRFGGTPSLDAALAYDATHVLVQAIAAAGADRAAIRDYLASMTEANAYHGITGTIRFLPNGDPVESPYRVTRVHDGAFTIATTGD